MYVPKFNREADPATLASFICEHSFALMITADDDGAPFATHMPVAHDPSRGTHGTLVSHLARANPQWRHFHADREVLVVFSGPHAYISPRWYEQEGSVPTWNYTTVHAYGVPRVIDDPARMRSILQELVATYEGSAQDAYRPDWSDPRLEMMLGAIVGFELEITRLEGKAKLSQNKSIGDQRRVIEALQASNGASERAVAALMLERLPIGDI